MRRLFLVLGVAAVALVLASGVALAATIDCPNRAGGVCVGTDGDDELTGSVRADVIYGRAGDDAIDGNARNDVLRGERGADELRAVSCDRDRVFGGTGNDLIDSNDECVYIPEDPPPPGAFGDAVYCGPGFDVVRAGREDAVAENCERVRRLSGR